MNPRGTIAALLFGNLVIGTGVMVLPGMLDHVARGLQVPVATAGQLIALGATVMCLGAPLVAATTSRIDRRRLLLFALGLYAIGHIACALAPGYASLAVLRMCTVLSAAIFTPQAAATIGLVVGPERRAAAVTAIFAGWSIASVLGMPLGNLVAAYFGWRWSFALVAVLAVLGCVAVWRTTPAGLTVPPLSLASWRAVAASRALRLVLVVTLVSGAGQFVLLSYIAPSVARLTAAEPPQIAALFLLFGIFGVLGNALVVRYIGRAGADRAVAAALAAMLGGVAVWAFGTQVIGWVWPSLVIGVMLWGLGCF
ncbi:MAG: MFS transporter, partial [Burkholderiales bacterium]